MMAFCARRGRAASPLATVSAPYPNWWIRVTSAVYFVIRGKEERCTSWKVLSRLGLLLAAVALLCLFQLASAVAREDREDPEDPEDRGAVYTMTNDPAGNKVLVFDRAAD